MAGLIALMAIGCGEDRRAPGKEYWLLVEIFDEHVQARSGLGWEMYELFVPDDRDVRLRLRARDDEPHHVRIPGAGVYTEVLPGRETQVLFRPPLEGELWLVVDSRATRISVLEGRAVHRVATCCPGPPEELTAAQWGAELFAINGCTACHATRAEDGILVGPNLAGIFGQIRLVEGGRSVLVDESYVMESIEYPSQHIAFGFNDAVMPPYNMTERTVHALAAFVASLSDAESCKPDCDAGLWPDLDAPAVIEPCHEPDRKPDLLGGVPVRQHRQKPDR